MRGTRNRRKSRRRLRKKRILRILALLIFIGAGIGLTVYEDSLVYGNCNVEAGVEVVAQDFLKRPDPEAYFSEGGDAINVHVPGDYEVKVKTGLFSHKSVLHVSDTVPPTGQAQDMELVLGETCDISDFVSEYYDETEVSLFYKEGGEPDFSQIGDQQVTVVLADLGENLAEVSANLYISPAVSELTMEAGESFPALSDFILAQGQAAFVTNLMAEIDSAVVGDYEVTTQVDGVQGQTVLHIRDTVAPRGETQDIEGYANVHRNPEDFVTVVEDATEVVCTYVEEPDLTRFGEQEVQIRLTDAGGNEALLGAKLTLWEDTEVPVIKGVHDIDAYIGIPVSYKKNVTVTDNCMEDLDFQVITDQVNLEVPGTYPIVYVATDASGNQARTEATITVHEQEYSEDEVNELADAVLARIFKEGMTPYDKTVAIYNYVTGNIGYTNHSNKGNWIQAAWEGLAKRQGDCYVYACVSKVLLTRAGIENMDIEKIPTRNSHYWNLVNLGTGWYHFDTTPRVSDHPRILLWSETQLMEYSGRHYGCHNYDHSLYPEVNTEPYEP